MAAEFLTSTEMHRGELSVRCYVFPRFTTAMKSVKILSRCAFITHVIIIFSLASFSNLVPLKLYLFVSTPVHRLHPVIYDTATYINQLQGFDLQTKLFPSYKKKF